jgi:hypothetical protein
MAYKQQEAQQAVQLVHSPDSTDIQVHVESQSAAAVLAPRPRHQQTCKRVTTALPQVCPAVSALDLNSTSCCFAGCFHCTIPQVCLQLPADLCLRLLPAWACICCLYALAAADCAVLWLLRLRLLLCQQSSPLPWF